MKYIITLTTTTGRIKKVLTFVDALVDIRDYVWDFLWTHDYRYVVDEVRDNVTFRVIVPDGWQKFSRTIYSPEFRKGTDSANLYVTKKDSDELFIIETKAFKPVKVKGCNRVH